MKSLTILVVLLFVGSSLGEGECDQRNRGGYAGDCRRMDGDMDLDLVMSTVISK